MDLNKNIPLVITSPRKVNEFQRLLETIEDPARNRSKSLPWQKLWKIRQESIEDVRSFLRRYSISTICSFHTDLEGEMDCISFMIIRPHLKISGDQEVLKNVLGFNICWTCTKSIISAPDHIVEIQRLLYLSQIHQMYPADVGFRDVSKVFSPHGAVSVKLYEGDVHETDSDTVHSLGFDISTPTTNSNSIKMVSIDALLKEDVYASSSPKVEDPEEDLMWKNSWDIQ